MARHRALRHDGGVDGRLELLGGEPGAVQVEIAVAAYPGPLQCLDPGLQAQLRHPQRIADFLNLVLPFSLPCGKEGVPFYLYGELSCSQLLCQQSREVGGDGHRAYALFAADELENVRRTGTRVAVLPELSLAGGNGKDMVHFGLLSGAVDLQVAHDQISLAPMMEKNKRVGGKKGGGIEHIGVALAGRDNK